MSVELYSQSTANEPVPLVVHGIDDLLGHLGSDLGVSHWMRVEQNEVTEFGRVTRDMQWIHVDPERASTGPFGAAVQHGFFTLSLATALLDEVLTVEDVAAVINYGVNRVRFPSPLRMGSRFRMHVRLAEAEQITGGAQVVFGLQYEIEGQSKPGCVADLVFRYVAEAA
jgi:acyl dehydratase